MILDYKPTNPEYNEMFLMDYTTLTNYLQNKYGKPTGVYFCTESCKSPNRKIKRTNEGLYIHHIAEYNKDYPDIQDLSKTELALKYPYEFQTPDYLCYCNYMEHIILHIKINEMRKQDLRIKFVDDGLIHHMFPELCYWFVAPWPPDEILGTWREKAYNVIRKGREDFWDLHRVFYYKNKSCPKYYLNGYGVSKHDGRRNYRDEVNSLRWSNELNLMRKMEQKLSAEEFQKWYEKWRDEQRAKHEKYEQY